MVEGYYVKKNSEKGLKVPTGRLHIEVTNLQEFQELIEQAKKEVAQLQRTIDRLSSFDLHIDFSVKEVISSES